MTYRLTDNIEVKLNKVTPKALKKLRESGVYDYSKPTNEVFQALQKAFLEDDEKFRLLLEGLFEQVPEGIELDDINLDEVSNALFDFFGKLAGRLGTLSLLSMTSMNSDLKTN